MKKLSRVLIAILLVVGFASSVVFAEGHGKKSMENMFEKKIKIIFKAKEELGITDDQMEQIKAIKMDVKKEIIMKQADIDVAALDIKAEMYKDKVDLKSVNKIIDKKYDAKKSKAKATVAACVKLKGILTEEQKSKLKEMKKKMYMTGATKKVCPFCTKGKMCGKCKAKKMKMMDK
ncbi:MAG: Spy/CpxP family protein refolding chaperone [Candidatus Zapsychrus exili]|nr:Spy/CpxP family protein refolding chaperone [Candidatus Zapsychrus exili]